MLKIQNKNKKILLKGRAQFEDGLLELISKLICKYGIKFEN